jgi:hypothetical protein
MIGARRYHGELTDGIVGSGDQIFSSKVPKADLRLVSPVASAVDAQLAKIMTLAQWHPLGPQDVVRGGGMEIEIRQ